MHVSVSKTLRGPTSPAGSEQCVGVGVGVCVGVGVSRVDGALVDGALALLLRGDAYVFRRTEIAELRVRRLFRICIFE